MMQDANARSKSVGPPSLSVDDFNTISNYVRSEFGINLSGEKLDLVQSRLSPRLRSVGSTSFGEYYNLVSSPKGQDEALQMLSALTTNYTSLFREIHHFNILQNDILPELLENAIQGDKIRIWSAGCSSGQEPYSIAAACIESSPKILEYDFKILATDIDPMMVEATKKAEFSEADFGKCPGDLLTLFPTIADTGFRTAHASLQNIVKVAKLNLVSDWPMTGSFDVIFCRNVTIYFDRSTQQALWPRFHKILKPNGILAIGHSERITGSTAKCFESIGPTIYRKRN